MLASVAFGAAFAIAITGCSRSSSTSSSGPSGGATIKIGVDFPLSGADATDGQPAANGVRLAVADANRANAVPGFTLEANVLDDAVNGVHDPNQGAKNIQSFASDASVLGVVGPFNSNVARAEIPLSNSYGLALVSPANTNPDLTKGPAALALRRDHPNSITYFRVCTTDDIQGPAGAVFAYKTLKARRAYVIDDDETYGKGIADQWAAQFAKLGGTILGHDHITTGQQDFHALLTKVASTHPDIVYYGGTFSTGGGLVRKQMPDAGIGNIPYAGGDGIKDQDFIDVVGSAANDSYATVAAPDATKIPAAQEFLKEYQATYHTPIGAYSASSYVAAMTIIHAIGLAVKANGGKQPSRHQVISYLRDTKDMPSIIGTFSFDANGDTTNRIISIWEAMNGQWVFKTQSSYAATK